MAAAYFNWRGRGWYAARQEGSHENQRIEYYQCGSNKKYPPDTRGKELGTPQWYSRPPKDPDIEVRRA